MPVLKNPKHELFAQELAKGKTQVEAYEIAGYKPNDSNAAVLANKPEIQGRLTEIIGKGAERAEVTVASIFTELEEARSLALRIQQPAPAVSASMGKAKIAGFLADKIEHTGKDGGPIETLELSEVEAGRRIAFTLAKARQQKQAAH